MTTTPTPADLLRAAADLLRDAANAAAEHSGSTTWESTRHFPDQPDSDFTTLTAGPGRPLHKGGGRGTAPYMHAPVSEYAALMGPGVGLALAQLLDGVMSTSREADHEECQRGCSPEICDLSAALAVARQLLGTNETEGPVAEPSADRRDRYAAAMALRDGHPEWPVRYEDDERDYRRRADAVMAVADTEVVQAMRAMHDTKEKERQAHRLALSEALGLGTGAPWDAIRDRAAELTAAPPAPADRAAVLNEVAAQYEQMLADIGADTAQDPRYWTGVQHVTLGLRRLAGEAAAGAQHPSPRIRCAHTDVLYGQCVRYLDDHDGDCQHEHQPTPAAPAAPEEQPAPAVTEEAKPRLLWSDLLGADPDITGGACTQCYMDRARDRDHDMSPEHAYCRAVLDGDDTTAPEEPTR